MNKENILAVADAIEGRDRSPGSKEGFNMLMWEVSGFPDADTRHYCATTRCIGGWAKALFPDQRASDSLDLGNDDRKELFCAFKAPEGLQDITSAQAVSCLRHLAKTGEVDWARAIAEHPA